MIRDRERLVRLLGGPAWAWWRRRAWRELAAGRSLSATWILVEPTAEERQAVNRLLATPGSAGTIRLRQTELSALLTESGIADDLEECVLALAGPLPPPDLDGPRWEALFTQARPTLEALVPPPALAALLDQGGLKRLAAGDPEFAGALIAQAVLVLQRMTAGRSPPLAQLAAECTGDAHALDRDQPLGRLVVRLLGEDADARSWRATWQRAGVATDDLSPTALVLNLHASRPGPLAAHLALAAHQGEPLRLTARQLRDSAPLTFPGGCLFVCENPAIVALAAEHLGPACPPLLASEGWPTLAVLDLLDRAREAGAVIRLHGDFDWPGLAIVGELLRRTGGLPWRFGAADVLTHPGIAGPPLRGPPVATPWDPNLAPALAARGKAIHEESLAGLLLGDLASGRDWRAT